MGTEFDFKDMPLVGILSQVAHLSGCYAKHSFETYDLKPWQAGILIVLSMEEESSEGTGKKVESDTSVNYNGDSENGKAGIYYTNP